MGYKNYSFGKNKRKNEEDRKRKGCVCGGHNATNVKKNLHHHSTLRKLWWRKEARFKIKQRGIMNDNI